MRQLRKGSRENLTWCPVVSTRALCECLLSGKHFVFLDDGTEAYLCDCNATGLWVRSPLEVINYHLLIFSFLHTGYKVKSGVEFRNSTRIASKTWRKVGN